MSHLTYEQRYTISVMLQSGHTQNSIAIALNKNKSVISREISRNKDKRNNAYSAIKAQDKCNERHKKKNKQIKFTPEMKSYVLEKLRENYSPEQIVGWSKRNSIECVSHQWIYKMVWDDKKRRGKLCQHLRSRGKRYKNSGQRDYTPGQPLNKRDISERPKIVDQRIRFGDLEVDSIIGKLKNKSLVTINDRATGILRIGMVQEKTSELVTNKILSILKPWKKYLHTITSDNGSEFAKHEDISQKLGVDYYFAKPYQSWQRGSNENLNRLIRQYLPKGTDFNYINEDYIKFIQDQINNRPRKRFNFKSPNEMFNQKVAFIG